MVWAQGQVKWAKVAKKSSTYDVTHKKTATPNQKIFIQVQATRLVAYFELLTGSVALTGPEKFPRKATFVSVFFFLKNPWFWPDAKVLKGVLGTWFGIIRSLESEKSVPAGSYLVPNIFLKKNLLKPSEASPKCRFNTTILKFE